jgi:hypothetical protein
MGHNPTHIMEKAADLIDESGGFSAFVQDYGIGGVVFAIFAQIITGIESAGTILLGPPRALGEGLIALVETTIGGMLSVLDAGTATTVESFLSGSAALLGPLAQPASVGVIMITLAVFIYGVNRLELSPLSFLQSIRR